MTNTHYDTLEISPAASQRVILAAYRTLSQKYHPDKNNGDKYSEEMMAKINIAFGVLSDPLRRKNYDDEVFKKTDRAKGSNSFHQEVDLRSESITTNLNEKAGDGHAMYSISFGLTILAVIFFASIVTTKDSPSNELGQKLEEREREVKIGSLKWKEAERYLTGIDSPQNFYKAKQLYEEIIEANLFFDKRAEQRLAEIYYFGLGQPVDFVKALELYKNIGMAETNFMAGMIYFQGIGVKTDWIAAYHHFNLAQAIQFDIRSDEYNPNPLIVEQQGRLMSLSKEESTTAQIIHAQTNRSYFSIVAKLKKDFLSKRLSTDEINQAQNLKDK